MCHLNSMFIKALEIGVKGYNPYNKESYKAEHMELLKQWYKMSKEFQEELPILDLSGVYDEQD